MIVSTGTPVASLTVWGSCAATNSFSAAWLDASTLRDPSLVDDRVQHPHRERALGARRRMYPMVCFRPSDTQTRADICAFSNRESAVAHFWRPELRVLARILDRRTPGFKEIGAKGNDCFGPVEPKNRLVSPSETRLGGGTRRFLANSIPEYDSVGAPSVEPEPGDVVKRRPVGRANQGNTVWA